MTETLAYFLLSGCGTIIMLLLAAIVYFLKKLISSNTSLSESVDSLKTIVALLESNNTNTNKACIATHLTVNTRLNSHAKRLNEHGESIAKLQVAIHPEHININNHKNENT